MSGPLETTFLVLSSSASPAASDLLIDALHSTENHIQLLAAEALLNRRNTKGQLAVVQQLENFTPEMRDRMIVHRQLLEHAIQQATVHGDPAVRRCGLMAIQWMESIELLPLLFTLLEDESHTDRHLIRQTISTVINKLYDNRQADRNGVQGWWVAYQPIDDQVHDVLAFFDRVITTAKLTMGVEAAVEGILTLGHPTQEIVKHIFRHPDQNVRNYAYDLLRTSRSTAIMRLINEFLWQQYLPPLIYDIFSQRDDLDFVIEALRMFPRKINANQQKNILAIKHLPWVHRDLLMLKSIPIDWQATLVKLITMTGIPDVEKQYVLEWIMRNGGPEGKNAAVQLRNRLDQETLQGIVLDGLESVEEEDQVWATHQLRSLAIPDTFRLLIDRLNSPLSAVREAARDELKSFNLELMLGKFETMEPAICQRAGQLLKKVDPQTLDALRRELTNASTRKRLRAIRGAFALGLHRDIFDELITLMDDEDVIIRRTIVEFLGTVREPAARDGLQRALNDPDLRVRRSAEIAWQHLESKRESHTDQVFYEERQNNEFTSDHWNHSDATDESIPAGP